ncbi:MAG: RNA-guided endonuclease InsQ/TnpB family protein [Fusobacteriaceae bacterium]
MNNKAYKIRLYPNKSQTILIDKTIGSCRFLYNQMLAEKQFIFKLYCEDKEALKAHSFKTEKQYKEEFEWLSEVSSRALQQSRINLETAYKNFFRELKKGKVAFPRFKSKHKSILSYREPQVGKSIDIIGSKIKLLKLGKVRFRGLSKSFSKSNKLLSATVSKDPDGKYYCSVLVEISEDNQFKNCLQITNKIKSNREQIGLDLGLTDFAITSNGQYFKPIRLELNKLDKKLKYWQKKFARQKNKSSKRRCKTKTKIAIIYKKQTNIKNHYQWHLANKLCSENQAISLETLKVKNMMKNRKLSRVIGQASWSSFITKLIQKAEQYNTKLHFQSTYFASTKTCYKCSFTNSSVKLSDRILTCPCCDFTISRDLQAGLNLEKQLSLEYSDYKHREIVRPSQVSFSLCGKFVEVLTNEVVYI